MTKDEALKLALEALKKFHYAMIDAGVLDRQEVLNEGFTAATAIKEALAQPEFIKHEVENADDWSEWVCPDPKGYLMKCCDCGLVHEAEFRIVCYKSETEREDCDIVDDPNLQAVFRMRRSEQWLPEDTAHRAGGLPMAQPEQEPVAWLLTDKNINSLQVDSIQRLIDRARHAHMTDIKLRINGQDEWHQADWLKHLTRTTPPQRTWVGLTNNDLQPIAEEYRILFGSWVHDFARAIETKLKEKNGA